MMHCFTNMDSIFLFLYEMCSRYEDLCTLETPHATYFCIYKREKLLFLKAIKKKLNDDPNEVKIYNFRTLIKEFTITFRLLFLEYTEFYRINIYKMLLYLIIIVK